MHPSPRCAWKEAQSPGQGLGEVGVEVFNYIMDSEIDDSGGGICLLVVEPGDLLDRCVNVRLICDPRYFSE